MNCPSARVLCLALAISFTTATSRLALAGVIPVWTTPDQTVVTLPRGGSATFRAEGYVTGDFDALLLFDTSGSMAYPIPDDAPPAQNGGRRKYDWALDGSDALIDALPNGVGLGLVDFDSAARLVLEVSDLGDPNETPSHRAALKAALRTLNRSGGTDIARAIRFAANALLNRPERSDSLHLVLMTDGGSNVAAAAAATEEAIGLGVDSINTVGLPGADTVTLGRIAELGNGEFADGTDLTQLLERFRRILDEAETLERLDIELPDGSLLEQVPLDGDGLFAVEGLIQEGDNVFRAHATSNLGNVVVRDLHIIGQTVPEPSAFALLAVGGVLTVFFGGRRFSVSRVANRVFRQA